MNHLCFYVYATRPKKGRVQRLNQLVHAFANLCAYFKKGLPGSLNELREEFTGSRNIHLVGNNRIRPIV